MNFKYSEYKENQNIVPILVPNKEEYYRDLMNIENSWTGRVDAFIANTFVLEAVQLIINSIALFEKGYFDCAYYALRQSLETSTTMVYLTESDDEHREKILKDLGFTVIRFKNEELQNIKHVLEIIKEYLK